MAGRHPYDWVEYGDSGVIQSLDELLPRLGELLPGIDVVPMPFRLLGSTGIVPNDWKELAQLILATHRAHPDIDGFVVTHGTATLEETAWFLDLVLPDGLPVVVTGAQRPFNTAGSDVAPNLRAAMAVAAAERAKESGVLVVLDNTVFPARDVIKTSSFDLDAFEAPRHGPLATVDAWARVHWRRLPAIRRPGVLAQWDEIPDFPRVDVAISYAGADGAAIDAFVAAGARGIVSAGLVPGRYANGERSAIERAVEAGVVVAQASRGTRGFVAEQRFLSAIGVIAGGDLAPQKLRIVLMVALARGLTRDEIQDLVLSC